MKTRLIAAGSAAPGREPHTGAMRDNPVTIPPALVKELWRVVKGVRDATACLRVQEDRLNQLLRRMKEAGMAEWLPTLDEVIADGPYERREWRDQNEN